MCPAIDITNISPRPEEGWSYINSVFIAPEPIITELPQRTEEEKAALAAAFAARQTPPV
jgi:hypothetical protein